jgi:hypothetical protein
VYDNYIKIIDERPRRILMQAYTLLIMEKEKDTGFFKSEVASYMVTENDEYIDSVYMIKEEEGDTIYLRLTTPKDVEDWEFEAIFDHYEGEELKSILISLEDIDDNYNPTWEAAFRMEGEIKEKIQNILSLHKEELDRVYQIIKDKKENYQ